MNTAGLLYLGETQYGSTSAHRKSILSRRISGYSRSLSFTEFLPTAGPWRSLFWRLQWPILLTKFNTEVVEVATSAKWELIWVDKGMFLSDRTFQILRRHARRLIYFTPDCLFFANANMFVNRNLHRFDLVCTTKSFEYERFTRYVEQKKICHLTQGYTQLKSVNQFQERRRWRPVGFVGKFERHRGEVVQALLDQGLEVHVAGAGWGRFKSVCDNDKLVFLGEALWGEEYRQFYQETLIGLGLLSKEFPELHTTRTFEIPYFGALLATERNQETEVFFDEDSALMYKGVSQLVIGIQEFLADREKLRAIAMQGNQRVITQRLSWADQIETVLSTLDRL